MLCRCSGEAVHPTPDRPHGAEAVGNIILSLHRNLQEIQSSLASGTFDAGLWGGRGAWLAERNGDVADSTVLLCSFAELGLTTTLTKDTVAYCSR